MVRGVEVAESAIPRGDLMSEFSEIGKPIRYWLSGHGSGDARP